MRSKRKDNTRFWVISVVFHVVLIGVFFLTPAGQRLVKRERPVKAEIIRKDEELAKVIDQIRQLAVGRLKGQVTALSEISDQMEANLEYTAEGYSGFLAKQLTTIRERLSQQAQATFTLQENLLEAIGVFAESESPDADKLNEIFEPSRRDIVTGLEEFRRALLLAASSDEPLLQELDAVGDKQFAAFGSVTSAITNRKEEVSRRSKLKDALQEKAELNKELASSNEQLESKREEYETNARLSKETSDERKKLEKQVNDLKQQIAAAKREKKDVKDLHKELSATQKKYKETTEEFRRVDQLRNKARSSINYWERKVKQQEKELQKLTGTISQMEEYIPTDVVDRKAAIAEALTQQQEAAEGQKEMYKQILALLEVSDKNGGEQQ